MPVVLVLVLVLVIELGESFLRIIEKRRRTGMWFRPWPRFMPPLRGSGCHFRGFRVLQTCRPYGPQESEAQRAEGRGAAGSRVRFRFRLRLRLRARRISASRARTRARARNRTG